MSVISQHFSEDDIRTKVVHQWLKDCGFSDNEISIEYSINIRLGRSVKTIHSRSDVLVRSITGSNLLIIEVKQPDHKLVEDDKLQAISYACALAEGGIAPFTILTNGKDSLIFDSVTGEEITDETILSNHAYVKNGFRVTGDSLNARAEALEHLISLSKENLLEFCKGQVQFRMELLKSDDPFSGKKYIPELYVDREQSKKELEDKLFKSEPKREVVLVIGPPQHGKTCFLCRSVEQLIDSGIPCLFYPAIALRKGLLNEMQEDFQWAFGENISPAQLSNRLKRIIENTGQQLFIFVDGWNEMVDHALIINDECQRLQQGKIQLVLSTTSPSLIRLLKDEADNLTYIASATNLNDTSIRKLTSEPLHNTKNLGIVQIEKYTYTELPKARKIYERFFNTRFPTESNLPEDPFYLRLAAEQYANNAVPAFATRTELIKNSLIRKGARRNIKETDLFHGLNQLAQVIVEKDAPFDSIDLPASFASDAVLATWIESAILICLYEKQIPSIDFYYTHDKDYCIAILNRKWHEKLISPESDFIICELEKALKTEASKSALRWFLTCPENSDLLKHVFNIVRSNLDKESHLYKILMNAIIYQDLNDLKWLENTMDETSIDSIFAYSSALIKHSNISFEDFSLQLRFIMKRDKYLDMDLSSLEDSIETSRSENLINVYLKKKEDRGETLRNAEHYISMFLGEDPRKDIYLTKIYSYLTHLIVSSEERLAYRSAKLFSKLSYRDFFVFVAHQTKIGKIDKKHLKILHAAMHYCLNCFTDDYYGAKCMDSGLLNEPWKHSDEEDEDELNEDESYDYDCKDEPEVIEEYEKMKEAYKTLLQLFANIKCIHSELSSLWSALKENISIIEEEDLKIEGKDINQLKFDL